MPHQAKCRHRFCWFYRVKQKPQDCVLTLDTARKMDAFAGRRVAPLPSRTDGAPHDGKKGSQRMRVLGFDVNNALVTRARGLLHQRGLRGMRLIRINDTPVEYDDPTCSATGTEMMRIFKAERARAVVEAAEHDEEPEVYLRFRSEEFYRVYSIPGKPPVAPPPEPTSDRPAGTVDLSVFGNARPAEHHNSKFKCDRGHEILTPRTHPREGRTAPAAVVSMACNADFGATVSVVDCRALLPEVQPTAGELEPAEEMTAKQKLCEMVTRATKSSAVQARYAAKYSTKPWSEKLNPFINMGKGVLDLDGRMDESMEPTRKAQARLQGIAATSLLFPVIAPQSAYRWF